MGWIHHHVVTEWQDPFEECSVQLMCETSRVLVAQQIKMWDAALAAFAAAVEEEESKQTKGEAE